MAKRVRVPSDYGVSDDVFDGMAGALSTGIKAQVMMQARKIFDMALTDTVSFEEALATVYYEGFMVGREQRPKRRARVKANGDRPSPEA